MKKRSQKTSASHEKPLALPALVVKQSQHEFYLCKLPAGVLVRISYAAIRGADDEAGAVQRFLNPRRIAKLKAFALAGGDFPGTVVLNWQGSDEHAIFSGGLLHLPQRERSAQIIDGQHRVAGLREAIREKKALEGLEVPVVLYDRLDTRSCADIFLAINTEQKPVAKSLVFDLYGVASQFVVDPPAVRAKDIAEKLNNDDFSPYFSLIKFPGSPRRKGGIALSTVVSALKSLVAEKGEFEQVGIEGLEQQAKILMNYFTALRAKYGDDWYDTSNAFMYAAGFIGAVDFFRTRLVSFCMKSKNFTAEFIESVIDLDSTTLIRQSEIRGLGGKDAPDKIFARLVEAFQPPAADSSGLKI